MTQQDLVRAQEEWLSHGSAQPTATKTDDMRLQQQMDQIQQQQVQQQRMLEEQRQLQLHMLQQQHQQPQQANKLDANNDGVVSQAEAKDYMVKSALLDVKEQLRLMQASTQFRDETPRGYQVQEQYQPFPCSPYGSYMTPYANPYASPYPGYGHGPGLHAGGPAAGPWPTPGGYGRGMHYGDMYMGAGGYGMGPAGLPSPGYSYY